MVLANDLQKSMNFDMKHMNFDSEFFAIWNCFIKFTDMLIVTEKINSITVFAYQKRIQ